jgi:hypothetical protein
MTSMLLLLHCLNRISNRTGKQFFLQLQSQRIYSPPERSTWLFGRIFPPATRDSGLLKKLLLSQILLWPTLLGYSRAASELGGASGCSLFFP